MNTNYTSLVGQAKVTMTGCLIAVLFIEGCSSVPPSNSPPNFAQSEGAIHSSQGNVHSSRGVVTTKSAEVVTANPSEKSSVLCANAADSPFSDVSAGELAAGAVMSPLMLLTPQGIVAVTLGAVVLPVVGVVMIAKHVSC